MIPNDNKAVLDNILEAIGKTPLVRLNKVTNGIEANVLVKCEHLNPSGSIKDRSLLCMIEDAEVAGTIEPDLVTIGEASSGNTAQALSMIGAVKGYKVKLYFTEPKGTPEKIYVLKRYGAELKMIPVDDKVVIIHTKNTSIHRAMLEIPGRVKCLKEEESNSNFVWMRQFSNPSCVAGVEEIGKELLEQLDGKIDVFVASIGTGGTFLGISKVLKEALPNVKCVGVQPSGLEGWVDVTSPDRKYIPGISDGIIKEICDSKIADEIVFVGNYEAKAMAYRLSSEEGIYCGMSSGANVYVALQEAKKPFMKDKNVVTPIVDRGDRNISDEQYLI